MEREVASLTNGEALSLIRTFTTSRLHARLLQTEKSEASRAESKLFWLCANGRDAETIDSEMSEVLSRLHERNDPRYLSQVALIQIFATAIRESRNDCGKFLDELRASFEAELNSIDDRAPEVRQLLAKFKNDLAREIDPLVSGIFD